MTHRTDGKRTLVTGGAGLIGSHLSELLLREGYSVRILDNLEPQTHRNGRPPWIPREAEFLNADIRDRHAVRAALEDVELVFHQAAYGGYMPEIAKFFDVNVVGTSLMLETIRDRHLPVEKVVVASSQAVYNEGAYACPDHGRFYGATRPIAQLQGGDFAMRCPICGEPAPPCRPTRGPRSAARTSTRSARPARNGP